MPKLPVLSGRDIVRGLIRLGFQELGQRGSHIKLRRGSITVIVPDHREIRKGTLVAILQQAGTALGDLLSSLGH